MNPKSVPIWLSDPYDGLVTRWARHYPQMWDPTTKFIRNLTKPTWTRLGFPGKNREGIPNSKPFSTWKWHIWLLTEQFFKQSTKMKAILRSAQSKPHSLAPLLIDSWSPDWRWPLGLPEISQFVFHITSNLNLNNLTPQNCSATAFGQNIQIFLFAILFVVSLKAISFVSHKSEFQTGSDFWGFIFGLFTTGQVGPFLSLPSTPT